MEVINERSGQCGPLFNEGSIYSNDRFHYLSYHGTSMKYDMNEPAIIQVFLFLFKS